MGLLSNFIVEANKSTNIDSKNAFLILQNMLGNLYQHEVSGVKFLDEEEIEKLAKATVSKVVEDCEYDLNSALVEILVKVRKLTLLWYYDSIQLTLYNVWTDKSEMGVIQENDLVNIDGTESKIIPLIVNKKKTYIAYSECNASLITFNLGKKRQQAILPFVFSLFLSQSLMNFKLEYSKMILTALKRYQLEMIHQMRYLKVNFEELKISELEKIKKYYLEAIDFLYRGLVNYRNDIESSKRSMSLSYRGDYSQVLSRKLGGGISKKIYEISPLRSLTEFDELLDGLNSFVTAYSELYENIGIGMNEMVKSKKENNPHLFKKAKDFVVERFDTISSKVINEQINQLKGGK